MRPARLVSGLVLLGAGASGAAGQTFATYFIDGINLTDAGRGTENVMVGDVVRMSVRVRHEGLSYAGGKLSIFSRNDERIDDITISGDDLAFPFDPWEIGREPPYRIVVSDGPPDATQPRNEDIVVIETDEGARIRDANDDFIDFASTPPGLGGLAGAFPLADGGAIFVFDYVYRGGIFFWHVEVDDTARLSRDGSDINGIEVPASRGEPFTIPSPGVVTVLAMAGVVRRRVR